MLLKLLKRSWIFLFSLMMLSNDIFAAGKRGGNGKIRLCVYLKVYPIGKRGDGRRRMGPPEEVWKKY